MTIEIAKAERKPKRKIPPIPFLFSRGGELWFAQATVGSMNKYGCFNLKTGAYNTVEVVPDMLLDVGEEIILKQLE